MITFIRRGPDSDYERWATVTRNGKLFKDPVTKHPVELFKIGVLAEAVERSTKALILWEKEGLLPMPTYKLSAEGAVASHRVYSAAQVTSANSLLRYFEVPLNGGGRSGQKSPVTIKEFLRHYSAVFSVPDVQIDMERGEAYVLRDTEIGSVVTKARKTVYKFGGK
jgi:hypothetical protein